MRNVDEGVFEPTGSMRYETTSCLTHVGFNSISPLRIEMLNREYRILSTLTATPVDAIAVPSVVL